MIVFFSLDPSPPELGTFPGQDKVMHFMVYTFLMLWFGCCYMPGKTYRYLGIGFILMGIVLEIIQGLVGYRSMEYFDMLVNSIGVAMGWLLAGTRLSSALIQIESRFGINRREHE
jgi:VanZ family protein